MNNRARDKCKHPNNWGPANRLDDKIEGPFIRLVILGHKRGGEIYCGNNFEGSAKNNRCGNNFEGSA